jgi:hypothetical protein
MNRLFGRVGVFLCSLLCLFGLLFFNVFIGERSVVIQGFSANSMAFVDISKTLFLKILESIPIRNDTRNDDFISSTHIFLLHVGSVVYQRLQPVYFIWGQSEIKPTAVLNPIYGNYIPFKRQWQFGSVCDLKGKMQIQVRRRVNEARFDGFSESFNGYPLAQSSFLKFGTLAGLRRS